MKNSMYVCNMLYSKLAELNDNSEYRVRNVVLTKKLNEIFELTFDLPIQNPKFHYLINENLILFDGEYYRIKTPVMKHSDDGMIASYTCKHLAESLQSDIVNLEETTPKTAIDLMKYALCYNDADKPTLGWSVGNVTVKNAYRGLEATETSPFSVLVTIAEKFDGVLIFHSKTKTIDLVPAYTDSQRSVFDLSVNKNLQNVEITYDTSDMVTKLYCFGAEDKRQVELTIMSVNPTGLAYITNFDYFLNLGYSQNDINAHPEMFVKTSIWRDTNYWQAQDLYNDGVDKLKKLAQPTVDVKLKALDLSVNNKDTYSIQLGDVVRVFDEDMGLDFVCNVTSIKRSYDNEHQIDIEVTNSIVYNTLLESIFNSTSTTNSITTADGKIKGSKVEQLSTSQIYDIEAKYASIEHLEAKYIDAQQIASLYVKTENLEAVNAKIENLNATYATIEQLKVANANIEELKTKSATIDSLNATNANIETLETNLAKINSLVNGNLTSDNIQALHLTVDNTTIDTALIKNVIAKNISVNDLVAGHINTNNISIGSDNGNMTINGETIQVADGSNIRVQIGKDKQGDYSLYVWDKTGNLMFDATGLKANAIKDDIIVNDMISDNANINGKKIDIQSLVSEVNNHSETIKSSLIKLDTTGQTLDVVFSEMDKKLSDIQQTSGVWSSKLVMNGNIIQCLVSRDGVDMTNIIPANNFIWEKYSDPEWSYRGRELELTDNELIYAETYTCSIDTDEDSVIDTDIITDKEDNTIITLDGLALVTLTRTSQDNSNSEAQMLLSTDEKELIDLTNNNLILK